MSKTIKMLKSTRGSPDGISVELYKEGQVYEDVSDSLANNFVKHQKVAVLAEKKRPAKEDKALKDAPANK